MLSYVNKLHMLIVSLGRKGRERLNKMNFYFVHSRGNHNFFSANVQSETFQVSAGVSHQSQLGCIFKHFKHLKLLFLPLTTLEKSQQDSLFHGFPGTMPSYPLGAVPPWFLFSSYYSYGCDRVCSTFLSLTHNVLSKIETFHCYQHHTALGQHEFPILVEVANLSKNSLYSYDWTPEHLIMEQKKGSLL